MVKHSQSPRETLVAPANNVCLPYPYHRQPVASLPEMITALPAGFRSLALNYRLSVPVMTLIHRVTIKGEYIDQMHQQAPTATINAANMQEVEYCVRLLTCPDITLVERACCIGLLVAVMDSSRTEHFSPYYEQQLQFHSKELLGNREMFRDIDLSEFYVWAAFDIAATMVPPRRAFLSPNYRSDIRFELLLAVLRQSRHLRWDDVLDILNKFFSTPRCIESWHSCWKLGLDYLAQLGN